MTVKGPGPGRQADRSRRTREALIRAGRELFAELGYAGTGLEVLTARAGVTRGALYHQFRDKQDLFLAVFEDVERDLVARLSEVVAGTDDPIEMLRRGSEGLLDACREPAVRQIALIDAPSVVGWEKWREVDAHYGLGLVQAVLRRAADDGLIPVERIEELSHLLLGALSEAAMLVAHRGDDPAVRARVSQSLRWLIDRLAA